ncbi:MAG: aminopeptidase P N-terminal domain-containing protein, partial [Cyanobacteria bacterium]|nr:aminopeptidase P N-terminal domain-containing protein [Cyanobacteriota bacterium]
MRWVGPGPSPYLIGSTPLLNRVNAFGKAQPKLVAVQTCGSPLTHPPQAEPRRDGGPETVQAQRRARFLERLGGAAAVIPAAPLAVHHADCEWPFRQNSDFWYLTGFDEPDAVALFLPHRPEGERYVLFVQAKEPGAEVWTGFRWGTEGAVAHFGAEMAHPLEELEQRLAGYLDGAEGIAFRVSQHPKLEPLVLAAWARQLDRAPRSGRAALGLVAPCPILHGLRLRKGPEELERMREAARISA